jgi:hypothetical protein
MKQRAMIPALRRSPSAVALLFAVVFAAVGVVTGQTQMEAPQEDVPQIEPRYTQVFASDTVDIMFPRVSPDGRWIVYSHATGAEATAGLRLVSVKGGSLRAIGMSERGGSLRLIGSCFSPTPSTD